MHDWEEYLHAYINLALAVSPAISSKPCLVLGSMIIALILFADHDSF